MRKEVYSLIITDIYNKTINKWLKISNITKLRSIIRESHQVIIKSIYITEEEYNKLFNL